MTMESLEASCARERPSSLQGNNHAILAKYAVKLRKRCRQGQRPHDEQSHVGGEKRHLWTSLLVPSISHHKYI